MKLPIKHEYFNQIKSGKKTIEFRDAHITFIDEETGETLRKEIVRTGFCSKEFIMFYHDLPKELFDDNELIYFKFTD